jgi:hypothetical protein
MQANYIKGKLRRQAWILGNYSSAVREYTDKLFI